MLFFSLLCRSPPPCTFLMCAVPGHYVEENTVKNWILIFSTTTTKSLDSCRDKCLLWTCNTRQKFSISELRTAQAIATLRVSSTASAMQWMKNIRFCSARGRAGFLKLSHEAQRLSREAKWLRCYCYCAPAFFCLLSCEQYGSVARCILKSFVCHISLLL